MLFGSQGFIEGILVILIRDHMHDIRVRLVGCTITRMTTQGRFRDLTISMATDVLPDPELPAIPMILRSCHGGEYAFFSLVADE
jgi:hypothetical protein